MKLKPNNYVNQTATSLHVVASGYTDVEAVGRCRPTADTRTPVNVRKRYFAKALSVRRWEKRILGNLGKWRWEPHDPLGRAR